MNQLHTKNVHEECLKMLNELEHTPASEIYQKISAIKQEQEDKANSSSPDIFDSVLTAHKILCDVKQMDEMAAFGHNPAVFYGLALSGECGELANKLIKVIRIHGSKEQEKEAVESELQDVIFYAVLLAYTLQIDLPKLVNEKAKIVAQRARDGYYGGILNES